MQTHLFQHLCRSNVNNAYLEPHSIVVLMPVILLLMILVPENSTCAARLKMRERSERNLLVYIYIYICIQVSPFFTRTYVALLYIFTHHLLVATY